MGQFAGFMWTCTLAFKQEQQDVSSHKNNTVCEVTLEKDSFLPFPCEMKRKNYWKNHNSGGSTSGGDQQTAGDREGAFPSRQHLADLDGLKHPLLQRPHMLSVYQSDSRIPHVGVFPTNTKEISGGHGLTRKRL